MLDIFSTENHPIHYKYFITYRLKRHENKICPLWLVFLTMICGEGWTNSCFED